MQLDIEDQIAQAEWVDFVRTPRLTVAPRWLRSWFLNFKALMEGGW